MSVAPAAPPPAALPPPASGAPPGAPPGASPFDDALEGEMARTAPAEGQKRSPGSESRSEDRVGRAQREATEPAAAAAAAVVQPGQTPVARSDADARAATTPAATPSPGAATQSPDAATAATEPAVDAVASPSGEATPAPAVPAAPGATEGAPVEAAAEEPAQSAVAELLPDEGAQPGAQADGSAPEAANALRAAHSGAPARTNGPARTAEGASVDVIAKGEIEPSREAVSAQPGPVAATPDEAEPSAPAAGAGASPAASAAAQPADAPAQNSQPQGAAQPPAPHTASGQDDSTQTAGEQRQGTRRGGAAAARTAAASGAGHDAVPLSGARNEWDGATASSSLAGPGPAAGLTPHSSSSEAPASAPAAAPAVQSGSASIAPGGAPQASARLGEMIDAIHATIELAARRGASQARIALEPAELGEIRIHLSQSAEGLVARVTAGSPEAAQALSAGRGELHQSLSSLGTVLLRLDIGLSGGQQGGGRPIGQETGASGGSARTPRTSEENISESQDEGAVSNAALNHGTLGALVDVLA